MDDMLKFDEHISNQAQKANKTYIALRALFCNAHLDKKAKIIAYQSLIRPILTYACPVWFNISNSLMEKMRIIERKILRTSTGLHRSEESNFTKRISNTQVYSAAAIPRLDTFIVKIVRQHIRNAMQVATNNLISGPFFPKDSYHIHACNTGFTPPKSFQFLDENNFIIVTVASPCTPPVSTSPRPGRLCRCTTRQTSGCSSPTRVQLAVGREGHEKSRGRGHGSPHRGDADGYGAGRLRIAATLHL
ncbi:unnamed protein product [Trichogramma brassicae]|nr:unnamed protein product [Trichogramma brassicae]CAB0041051.1 unnamed protein product [Trichogramma brassicae]CAB0041053.1 unnamed protein product [Trichogramma brassicae]CAB0041054.1 unnamed protein product [Trichogramma brassicae]CAB0041056.1 unnamed protein product [Trichogramma brassicae]